MFSSSKASIFLHFLSSFGRFCLVSYLPLALVSSKCICAKTKNTDFLFYTLNSVFFYRRAYLPSSAKSMLSVAVIHIFLLPSFRTAYYTFHHVMWMQMGLCSWRKKTKENNCLLMLWLCIWELGRKGSLSR